MKNTRAAREDRTALVRIVADGDYDIEVQIFELIEALAVLPRNVQARFSHHPDRPRI
jgi:hypothetical protein